MPAPILLHNQMQQPIASRLQGSLGIHQRAMHVTRSNRHNATIAGLTWNQSFSFDVVSKQCTIMELDFTAHLTYPGQRKDTYLREAMIVIFMIYSDISMS